MEFHSQNNTFGIRRYLDAAVPRGRVPLGEIERRHLICGRCSRGIGRRIDDHLGPGDATRLQGAQVSKELRGGFLTANGAERRHQRGTRNAERETRNLARNVDGARRLSYPAERAAQLAWRLVGNSLSVPAVRYVLSAIPELADNGSAYSR